MTNDNTPAKPIEERFTIALAELVGMCAEAGMHPMQMIGPLKDQLAAARQEAMPAKADEDAVERGGFPRAQEAELRVALKLEPGERLPPYR